MDIKVSEEVSSEYREVVERIHKQRIFAFELICASSVDKSTDA